MPRTPRTHLTTLTFPSGNTFTLQTPAPSSSTVLKFAAGSTASTGLHWHETHTEYFSVLQGVAKLILADGSGSGVLNIHYVSKDSGVVTVPRYRLHCLGRGDVGAPSLSERDKSELMFMGMGEVVNAEEWNQDLLVKEWTEPNDGQKEVFFRNLAGVISEPRPAWLPGLFWGLWVELQIWIVGAELDNFPAVFGGRWWLVEWVVVHAVCWWAVLIGKCVGLRGSYVEYTPVELRPEEKKRT